MECHACHKKGHMNKACKKRGEKKDKVDKVHASDTEDTDTVCHTVRYKLAESRSTALR